MADKPWENEPLPRAQGQVAPAKWDPNEGTAGKWVPYEVDQRTILVDEEGNPVDLSTPDNQDVTIANPYDDERIKESVDGVKVVVEGIEIPDADYTDITSKLDHLNATIEAKEVDFPEIQKVEVANQQEIPDVEFPDDYPDSTANERLQAIEQTQGQIIKALQTTNESLLATNEHLNSVIEDGNLNTQLNGSNVEQDVRVTGAKRDEITIFPRQVRQSGGTENFRVPPGVTSILLVHIVYQVSGDFTSEQGHKFWVAPFEGSTGRVLFGTTSDYGSLMGYSTRISSSSSGSYTFMFNPYADNMLNPQQD